MPAQVRAPFLISTATKLHGLDPKVPEPLSGMDRSSCEISVAGKSIRRTFLPISGLLVGDLAKMQQIQTQKALRVSRQGGSLTNSP